MPIFRHFLRRQYWHWFLWCWSIGQFRFPLQEYVRFRLTDLLKKDLQPVEKKKKIIKILINRIWSKILFIKNKVDKLYCIIIFIISFVIIIDTFVITDSDPFNKYTRLNSSMKALTSATIEQTFFFVLDSPLV